MTGRVDLSEASAARPLTSEEIDALLAGEVKTLTHASTARVLVRRMRATMLAADEQHRENRRDLVRALEGSKMAASPLSSAIAALGRLTSVEQQQVFSISAESVLDRLREAVSQAHDARVAGVNASRWARLALSEVLADGTVPEPVKVRVRARLQSLEAAETAPSLVDADADAHPAITSVTDPFTVPAAATGLDDLFS